MAMSTPNNSVWSAMSYVPPRGRCNFKTSLMSPACACLRFMLHPVKAATSFECDGCSHHASFHSLENPAEDAIRQRWSDQDNIHSQQQQSPSTASSGGRGKKRKAISQSAAHDEDDDPVEEGFVAGGSSRSTARMRAERQGSRGK